LFVARCIFLIVSAIFIFMIFKNISYPLFWADESMTAVGAQRVLEFGYPKVHDGKNVFYDLRHSNPTLGIDPATDAYIGGTGWGHYYYGALGEWFAKDIDDLYVKTGIIRYPFAFLGIAGLFLFVGMLTMLFEGRFSKYAFAAGFVFLCLMSISLGLHLRQARYYALVIFSASTLCGVYIIHRFLKKLNPHAATLIIAALLLMLFISFAPTYFIFLLALVLSEAAMIMSDCINKRPFKSIMQGSMGTALGMIVSLLIAYPLLSYFKIFEISEAMAKFNNYDTQMYWENIGTIFRYFENYEMLWLFLSFKVLLLFNLKRLDKTSRLLQSSLFLTLTCVLFCLLIARVPNFIFTRYIIYIQPLISAGILLDLLILWQANQKKPAAMLLPISIFVVCIFMNAFSTFQYHSGRLAELFEPYKGPLDYTIPFIRDKYKNTESLVIAANYEETSYMYYLNCKAVVGYTGNNLAEDAQTVPDIICYRKSWGNFRDIFEEYFKKANYQKRSFDVFDNPVNNIPELNFRPPFNHRFKTQMAKSEKEAAVIYCKSD